MATRSGLAMAPGGPRVRLHDEHQSGRSLGPRARPHALGCGDGAQGRRATGADPERDVVAGDHPLPSPEAALVRPGGLMPPAHAVSVEAPSLRPPPIAVNKPQTA